MLLLLSNLALATDPVDLGVLKNSDLKVVQKRLYTQEDRLEMGAHLGLLPFDLITVTPYLFVNGTYHFSESAAVEGRLGGGYGFETPFYKALEVDGTVPEAYRYLASFDADFQWTPVYGKVALLGKTILHSDLYLSAGAGITMEQSLIPSDNNAVEGKENPAAYLLTFAPTFPIAFGAHYFLGPNTAIRLEVRDSMMAEYRVQTQSTWFRQSLGVSAGFTYYGKKK
jgi:outer membrane beta-barrel protein